MDLSAFFLDKYISLEMLGLMVSIYELYLYTNRNCHTLLQTSYTILHSCQRCMRNIVSRPREVYWYYSLVLSAFVVVLILIFLIARDWCLIMILCFPRTFLIIFFWTYSYLIRHTCIFGVVYAQVFHLFISWEVCFLILWSLENLNIYFLNTRLVCFYWICKLKTVFPSLWLVFFPFSTVGKVLNCSNVWFIEFFFCNHAFYLMSYLTSKLAHQTQGSVYFLLCFLLWEL